MNSRELAYGVLNRCEKQQQYSNLSLDSALKKHPLSDADRGLATALVYGVLEKKLTLDYQLAELSSRLLSEITPEVLTVLRMGLYQLAFLDRVPDHAAVSESVELAGKRAGGFVNAILRSFLRRGKRLSYPDPVNTVDYLSVKYSVCPPLCRRYLEALGREKTESLLAAFGVQPPLTLRVNTLKTSPEALLERLTAAGFAAERASLSKNGIRILGNAPVPALPGFTEGNFFVQDEASQLCVEALEAQPGMQVLDTCACPGSKSFGIAMELNNQGHLISCDLHASKLSLVRSGAERLGISVMEVLERDARAPMETWTGRFDRILCDVPCSGFGVLAKKPELRYKDPAVSDGLPEIQLAILRRSLTFLRKGGRLVYSTCTVLPSENEGLLRHLQEETDGITVKSAQTYYPDTHGTDGFFVAVLEKQ